MTYANEAIDAATFQTAVTRSFHILFGWRVYAREERTSGENVCSHALKIRHHLLRRRLTCPTLIEPVYGHLPPLSRSVVVLLFQHRIGSRFFPSDSTRSAIILSWTISLESVQRACVCVGIVCCAYQGFVMLRERSSPKFAERRDGGVRAAWTRTRRNACVLLLRSLFAWSLCVRVVLAASSSNVGEK